jgi:hypothetical protein
MKSSIEGSSGIDFHAWYSKNGLAWGAGDMFVVAGGNPSTRIAEVIAILAASFHADGNPVFSEIVIVQPPANMSADERMSELLGHLDEAVQRSRGRALEPADFAALSNRMRIVVPPDLQSHSVPPIIAAAKLHSAVVVGSAARYRKTASSLPGETPILRMPEDVWVPHFHDLCEGAVAAARTSQSYIALDANEDWPCKEDNRQLLLSIEGLAVLAGDHPEGPQAILAQYTEKWRDGINRGVVGPILNEIDALPDDLNDIKPLLKLQMMHKAGLHPMVEQMLKAEPHLIETLAPLPSLQVAEMAADAGAPDIARRLMQRVAFEQLPAEAIEFALALAQRVGEPVSAQHCEELLHQTFPESLGLLRHRADKLLAARNFHGLAKLLARSPIDDDRRVAGFYEAVGNSLASPPSDYQALARSIITAHPAQAARARLLIASEAVRAEQYAAALSVATEDVEDDVTSGITAIVLSALEAALLTRDKEKEIGLDRRLTRAGILLVIRYLAHHPGDARTRVRLVDVLSAESMGHLGLALLIDSAVRLASAPLSLRDIRTLDTWTTAPPPDDMTAFLKVALPWLESASPFFVGRVDIPRELLTLDADKLVTGISRLLEYYEPLDTPVDLATVRNMLALGMAVARHGSIPDADLTLVRVLAVRLALASRFQAARDYA